MKMRQLWRTKEGQKTIVMRVVRYLMKLNTWGTIMKISLLIPAK